MSQVGSLSSSGGGGGGSAVKFQAYLSADVPDVTGNGTYYNVICNTEIIDVSNNYDNTTGIFTAPSTGFYLFNCSYGAYKSSGTTATSFYLYIKLITNTNQYILSEGITSQDITGTGVDPHTISNSINIQLNAGDTVRMSVASRVGGSALLNIGVKGFSSSVYRTMFSGQLLN